METLLKTNKNRFKSSIILITLFGTVLCLFFFKFPCLFTLVFGIPCPSCGLTRALEQVLNGNFVLAFQYNVLIFPLIFVGMVCVLLLIKDFILNENSFFEIANKFICKYYVFIILALLVSFVVNLFRYL